MKIIKEYDIFDNKLPQLKSRQGSFPYIAQTESGKLYCTFVIGEAFESVDGTSYITESTDGGSTWSEPKKMFDKSGENPPISDCCKITDLGDGNMICLGYAYPRPDPDLPLGNPETGGLLDDFVFYTKSCDGGKTWDGYNKIDTFFGSGTEASAPLTILKNGDWVSPITGFPDWNGNLRQKLCGKLLRSNDKGKTWTSDVTCMEFPGDNITCYEQRLTQLETGEIVVIGWNENTENGKGLNNHYTVSYDNGLSFTAPADTGIAGQATSLCALGGSKLLALHSMRKGAARPGVYGYVVDLAGGKWNIESEHIIWEPSAPLVKDKNMAEIFAYLKFGQPSTTVLKNGNLLVVFWYCENGQYKIRGMEIKL